MSEQPQTASSNPFPPSSSSSSSSSPPPPPPSPPPQEASKQSQVPELSGFIPAYPSGDLQMFPIMYPAMVPANQEHPNRGAGIYAVPVAPFLGPISAFPSNNLIPLTYNIPTRPSSDSVAGGDQGHGGQQQQQQQQQQAGPQRQVVVRRFQIAFQLDLLLILKLAAVIFLFNQDGSRQKLVVLVLFALLVYLYQTGALAPLVRWLSQSMQRAAAPPRPPRPAVRAENAPLVGRQNENAPLADGQAVVAGENLPGDDGNHAGENENLAQPDGVAGGNQWWGIVKEIQMILIGFITSLLPGFHNVD